MKSRVMLILAVLFCTLAFAACKQPNMPSTPSNPEPRAEAPDPNAPGTTTNFESQTPAAPARPAE
jgi:hypothetical protein